MALQFNFEKIDLNHFHQQYFFSAIGWFANDVLETFSIHLLIDGVDRKDFHCFTNTGLDIADQNTISNSPLKNSFRIEFRSSLKPDKIEISVVTSSSSQTILELNKDDIRSNVHENAICYKVESAVVDSKTSIGTITGWIVSLDGKDIDYCIKANDSQIKSTIRRMPKETLLNYHITDQEHLYSGFRICFKYEKDLDYVLCFSNHDSSVEESLQQYLRDNEIPLKNRIITIFKNINIENITKFYTVLKQYGLRRAIEHVLEYRGTNVIEYNDWFLKTRITAEELEKQKKVKFQYEPFISIVVPTYNTPEKYLREMIDSVIGQSYANWQLSIADGSDEKHTTRAILREYCARDKRIKVHYLKQNKGISENTNAALKEANGEYIAFYDHDDFLEKDALYEVVKSLQEEKYDIIYTDEDKYNCESKLFEEPNLKPDFNPDLFCSHNYITHLFVVKKEILESVGFLRSKYDGAQDYDLMFRCIEASENIFHIPKVLYHWRMYENSTAMNPKAKMYAYEAGRRAIEDHFKRCDIPATVEMLPEPYYGQYHSVYSTGDNPLISVIIPNCEHTGILKKCLDSLLKINVYKNFEVIVVENGSKKPETFDFYKKIQNQFQNIHVIKWERRGFNYSAINNYGAKYAHGDYFLFLNNDTEIISPTAIQEMLGLCMRPDTGVVGAKLLYSDNTIQHAGVIVGFSGYADHVFRGIDDRDEGYMFRAGLNCDYSAVTGACMMTKKSIFKKVSGFDESLAVAGNDIDYCLKVRKQKMQVVYNAFAKWHHYESKTRGYDNTLEKTIRFDNEVEKFQKKWHRILLEGDPYYNKNFHYEDDPFILGEYLK